MQDELAREVGQLVRQKDDLTIQLDLLNRLDEPDLELRAYIIHEDIPWFLSISEEETREFIKQALVNKLNKINEKLGDY